MKQFVLPSCLILSLAPSSSGQCVPARDAAKLLASDGDWHALLAAYVAISGDTAIAGAPGAGGTGANDGIGAAYIFERDQGGPEQWGQVRKLVGEECTSGSACGNGVAIDGDIAVISASHHSLPFTDMGLAYVFERDLGGPDSWGERRQLQSDNPVTLESFGVTISISGGTIAVGALADDSGHDAGAAYVFDRNAGGADNWGQVRRILAFDGEGEDWFATVALEGDTLLVGAPGDDGKEGSFYVYERDQGGPDNWGHVIKRKASDAAPEVFFAYDVAISGDTAVISAVEDDDGGERAGAAYVFERNAGGPNNWGQVKKLLASDPVPYDSFGENVAIAGNVTLVGAKWDDDVGSESGSVYIFHRNAGGPGQWGQVDEFHAPYDNFYERFGFDVAIDGETSIVGAPADTANTGAGWIFEHWTRRNYCEAIPNSTGSAASIGMSGTTSLEANDLVLTVQGAPGNQLGLFLVGQNPAAIPVGNGTLCIGTPRYRVYPAVVTSASGSVAYPVDYGALPTGAGELMEGSIWSFQFWFRDPAGGGARTNFTDGLMTGFCN